jgi:hypothetical protein
MASASSQPRQARRVALSPGLNWRRRLETAAGANLLVGAWLLVAAAVLAYGSSAVRWHDGICGAIIVAVAATRALLLQRHTALSWLNGVCGLWVFASAFWLDRSAWAAWNAAVMGLIVVLLAIVAINATSERPGRRPQRAGPAPASVEASPFEPGVREGR